MLSDSEVIAMVAVSDIEAAKQFYGDMLGLKQVDENPGGVAYKSGGSTLFVYSSDTAGKNESTSASWNVDDIDKVVEDLRGKGVSFEHYDFPDMSLEGDVHVMGNMKAAWFRDPDGNILGLNGFKV